MRNFKNVEGRYSYRKSDFSTRENENHHARRWVKRNLEKFCRRDSKADILEGLKDVTMEDVQDEVEYQFEGTWEYFEDHFEEPFVDKELDGLDEAEADAHFIHEQRLDMKACERAFYEDDYYDPSDDFDTASGWH